MNYGRHYIKGLLDRDKLTAASFRFQGLNWVDRAAARALGARDRDPRVRNPDWLAERLIGPEERAMLGPLAVLLDRSSEQAGTYPQQSVKAI
jgi:hypothetical protein